MKVFLVSTGLLLAQSCGFAEGASLCSKWYAHYPDRVPIGECQRVCTTEYTDVNCGGFCNCLEYGGTCSKWYPHYPDRVPEGECHRVCTTQYTDVNCGGFCDCLEYGGAGAHGDPHFLTWAGKQFDFHGACDLTLLENPAFANGRGMKIAIRTEAKGWWSYIDVAAVQIDESILEVKGGTKVIPYWINGVETPDMVTGESALGDYPVKFKRINDHQTQTRVDLGNGDAIGIETFKHFVRVNLKDKSNTAFVGSNGLLGVYPTGQKTARDGVTIMEDNDNEFGQEWQVQSHEPTLFQSKGSVQHPMKCVMPDQTKKQERRLGESVLSEKDATLACARVEELQRDACIFDVLATNDLDMVGSY